VSSWFRWEGKDLLLRLRVQPRARSDEWAGPYQDRIRVRITAPPVEGKANAHLIRFLAKQFGVNTGRVRLESGAGNRGKNLRILAPRRLPGELSELCQSAKAISVK